MEICSITQLLKLEIFKNEDFLRNETDKKQTSSYV
jgi:hypothetical protein